MSLKRMQFTVSLAEIIGVIVLIIGLIQLNVTFIVCGPGLILCSIGHRWATSKIIAKWDHNE